MDDTTIEQDPRCIRNIVKHFQRFVIFIIIVMRERLNPSLNFLIAIT